MDRAFLLILLWSLAGGFFLGSIALVVFTPRNDVRVRNVQITQLSNPVATWTLIVGAFVMVPATAALGIAAASFGFYAWFSIPMAASFAIMAAFQIWVWRLPIPPIGELVENV